MSPASQAAPGGGVRGMLIEDHSQELAELKDKIHQICEYL